MPAAATSAATASCVAWSCTARLTQWLAATPPVKPRSRTCRASSRSVSMSTSSVSPTVNEHTAGGRY